MSASLTPITDFLAQVAALRDLPNDDLAALARQLEIEYHRKGAVLRELDGSAERLYVVRTGALMETDAGGLLVSRYAEGEIALLEELLSRESGRTVLRTSEDSLIYSLSRVRFEKLISEHPQLARTLSASVGERLRRATLELCRAEPSLGSTTSPVETLLARPIVSIHAAASISEAARVMHEHRVSALVITGAPELGIVTDRDLRSRVLAEGRPPHQPIATVMSCPTVTIKYDVSLFEALLLMLEKAIHHLVVTRDDIPIGVITTTDLIRAQSENPVFVVGDINKQTTLQGLVEAHRQRERVLSRLVLAGARAVDIQRVLSGIADTVMRRVIILAEAELRRTGGREMPPHCWVAFGSLARSEITLGSDQDNGLILGKEVSPTDEAARFIAERVSDGLAACGYPKCKGDVMATTDRYRQPASVWRDHFSRWMVAPEKRAVMHANIFFDSRAIAGDAGLLEPLQAWIGLEAAKNQIFLAHMAKDAMARRPPLGLFRQFVVETGGAHADSLDLKHRGLIPIVDLARVLGLEAGYSLPGTLDRLNAASARRKLSRSGCSDLTSAYEYIALLRLKHQVRARGEGRPSDSYLNPNDLSATDRRSLKDAFVVIKTVQEAVYASHQLGAIAG